MFNAIQGRDWKKVKSMVQESPNLANVENEFGESALNSAVEGSSSRKEIVKILLQAGADANHDTQRLGTPLSYAAYHGDAEMVEMLLDGGAKIDLAPARHGDAPLLNACLAGKYENVKLLLERGADVKVLGGSGASVLYCALFSVEFEDRVRIVKLLLEHGADPSQVDPKGLTARMYGERHLQDGIPFPDANQRKGLASLREACDLLKEAEERGKGPAAQ